MESYYQKLYRQVQGYQFVKKSYEDLAKTELQKSQLAFVPKPEERRTILVNSYYISENKRYCQRRSSSSMLNHKWSGQGQQKSGNSKFGQKQLFITDLQ